MKNKAIVKAAEEAKKDGFEFMSTVVKKEHGQLLYHVVSIDVIIKFGHWPTAKIEILDPVKVEIKGKEVEIPRHGVKVYKKLPEKTISKSEALRKYR